ncbi:hypothetical protein [Desulfuribacillus alkaliarsenatis]|uniref:Uncharacterized protein n=1 Tax=Desulfuribacillus alkaliarsenatis TaxID=766136 RepID=A0A1E5G0I9_9FIRM|nr:hypothetical protein [Desulfuribacillus alkaliarsenatis]OEF96351.1 hypothetical protein BHF68_09380 [Desulfuribacillus alkaliarsenatis]
MNDKRIIILLVTVMALQLFTWNNTRGLETQIRNLQNQVQNIQSDVSHEVSNIRYTVQQMREDANWWTNPDFQFETLDSGETVAIVSWQLKEYTEADEVYFNYSFGNDQSFTQIKADEIANGYFSVNIEIDVPKEPIVDIYISRILNNGSRGTSNYQEEVMEEAKTVAFTENSIMQYYVSLDDGQRMLTSDAGRFEMRDLQYKLFGYKNLIIREHRNVLSANMYLDRFGYQTVEYKIERAYLENRSVTNEALAQWEFELPSETDRYGSAHRYFYLHDIPTEDLQRLYLVLEYSGGYVFEEQIKLID